MNVRSSTVAAESGNLFGEIAAYRQAGVDGLFSDNTDIAVAAEGESRRRQSEGAGRRAG